MGGGRSEGEQLSGGEAVITCLWSYTSGGGIAIRQGFLRVANVFGSALTANY